MTTSSRGRRKVTGRTAFLDGLNFTLLKTSHQLVDTRSRPTDLVRSAALGAKIKFQSRRGSSDRYSLRRFSNQYTVQFDLACLCNIRNKSCPVSVVESHHPPGPQSPCEAFYIWWRKNDCHLDGSPIRKHTESVVTEWGKRELRHDGARARYMDVLHATVWYLHPFDLAILPIDGGQRRIAVIKTKPCLVLDVEKH